MSPASVMSFGVKTRIIMLTIAEKYDDIFTHFDKGHECDR